MEIIREMYMCCLVQASLCSEAFSFDAVSGGHPLVACKAVVQVEHIRLTLALKVKGTWLSTS